MPRSRSRSASPPRHRRHRRHSRSRSRSPRRRSKSHNSHRNRHRKRSTRREMPKKNRIPDNWDDVAKMGTLVGTSRFLPLRVPLDAKYLPQFHNKREEIWTPKDFLETQEAQNLNVKMIIDLTNTFKYYDGEREFKDSGVEYVKLKIEGFNGPPDGRDVDQFMNIVDEFVARESEGNIAMHCTHGLNRTGYLVVTYMVERLGYTVTDALEAFKVARPPGLIKHMYVEDLYKRLGEGEEVKLPELPEWASAKYGKRAHEGKKNNYRGKHRNHGRSERNKPQGTHRRFEEEIKEK
ncbi:Dual specificity phosphatase catalytic domain-containing protein [Phytophthora infestans]|uniref:Dual specificity phosphatase catalytic domain-containing protein n=1 Tax=Phytophthora infestans TaxID=4787 RepID=A0A8S9TJ26_PHYIN|nr:Dual specificity phosphatase catalytic domain-containing protein [Phytophthora infestans]